MFRSLNGSSQSTLCSLLGNPGEALKDDFLEDMVTTQRKFFVSVGIPQQWINEQEVSGLLNNVLSS